MSEVTIQIHGTNPESFVLLLDDAQIAKFKETLRKEFHLKKSKEEYYEKKKAERKNELAEELANFKEAYEEFKLIKAGKLRAIPIEELLNEKD